MFHAFFEHLWNDMLTISDDRACSPLSKLIQVHPSSSSPIFPRNFRLIAWPQLWAHRLKGNCIPREQMQRAWDKWMRYTSLLEKLRKPRLKKRDHEIAAGDKLSKRSFTTSTFCNILQHLTMSFSSKALEIQRIPSGSDSTNTMRTGARWCGD